MKNNKQQLQETREDAMLRLLMEEYAEAEGEALWREFQAAKAAEEEQAARERENRESGRGSEKENRRIRSLSGFWNGLQRVALIVLLLGSLLPPLIMSVEAFKIPVLNYIVDVKEKFSGFSFGENDALTDEQEEIIDLIMAAPCPEGYRISDYKIGPSGRIWLDYEYDGNVSMTVSIYPSEGQINIDTEDIEQIHMKIHDYEAIYLRKKGHRLIWMDAERNLVFNLYSLELEDDDFWRYVYILVESLVQ